MIAEARPDIVPCDVRMRGASGLDLCRCDDVPAGLLLFRGRHRVLQVEEDDVGGARRGSSMNAGFEPGTASSLRCSRGRRIGWTV